MPSIDKKLLLRRAAFVTAAVLTLSAGECPSRGPRDQYSAQLDQPDASVALGDELEFDPPLGDPGKGDVLVLGGDLSKLATAKTGEVEYFDAKKKSFGKTGKLAQNRIVRGAVVLDGGSLDGQALLVGGISGEAKASGADLAISGKALDGGETFDADSEKSKKLAKKLNAARIAHTETLLNDGRVLIAGGFNADGAPLTSTELFDPAAKTFTPSGTLKSPRALHSATLLKDGRVLLAGGVNDTTGDVDATGEIYDPATGLTALSSNAMQSPAGQTRLAGHTATLIEDCGCDDEGRVLIAGGFTSTPSVDRALENASTVLMVFDPATRRFSATGMPQMTDDRLFHTATALPGGKILVAGGIYGNGFFAGKTITGVSGGVLASAEIYDAAVKTVACVDGVKKGRCADAMSNSRVMHSAMRIRSGPQAGKVLLVGGAGAKERTVEGDGAPLKTAELFDPKSESFKPAGSMKAARIFPAIALVD